MEFKRKNSNLMSSCINIRYHIIQLKSLEVQDSQDEAMGEQLTQELI